MLIWLLTIVMIVMIGCRKLAMCLIPVCIGVTICTVTDVEVKTPIKEPSLSLSLLLSHVLWSLSVLMAG